MTELSIYWQVRMLMAEAIWAVNEMDSGASPELHADLHRIGTPCIPRSSALTARCQTCSGRC